jgi:hypothetical protein
MRKEITPVQINAHRTEHRFLFFKKQKLHLKSLRLALGEAKKPRRKIHQIDRYTSARHHTTAIASEKNSKSPLPKYLHYI